MADHSSDEESSDSDVASIQSSHSSGSSYSRQSSRSADSSSRGGGSVSVASTRSDDSSRSAASSRSSRSRSSSRSSSSRSSRRSSVASRSDALSFDIEDAAAAASIALTQDNHGQEESDTDHSDDDSVSSGPPTSASDSRDGSRSPFTEAESQQSRSEVSSVNMGEGEKIVLNRRNGHLSPQSSSDHHNRQYQNGRSMLTQSMVAAAAENLPRNEVIIPGLTDSMKRAAKEAEEDNLLATNNEGRRVAGGILTDSMIAAAEAAAAENSPQRNERKRVPGGLLTSSMIATAPAQDSPAKNEGKRVPGGLLTNAILKAAAEAEEDNLLTNNESRRKRAPLKLTKSMIAATAELAPTPSPPTEEKRVMERDEVIGSTIELPTLPLETKYIQIKLMDPTNNDDAAAEPIFVTMKIEIPTSQEPSWSNIDTSVGMGQTVQMSFLEDYDQGRPIKMQGKRVAITHDESDRERIKTETEQILSEVAEELSPDDIVERKNYGTEAVQPKNQYPVSFEPNSNGPIRRISSAELKQRRRASIDNVPEEFQNNRPALVRRRSSVELLSRRSSFADVTDEHQNNRPVRRASSVESFLRASINNVSEERPSKRPIRRRSSIESSSVESSSVESPPRRRSPVENVTQEQQNNRPALVRKSSAELKQRRRVSVDNVPQDLQNNRPALVRRRSSVELLGSSEHSRNRPIRRRSSIESSSVESSSVESSPRRPPVENVSEEHESNRPTIVRRRSSAELKQSRRAPVDNAPEEQQNNRPPLMRRRSSVELLPSRRSSIELQSVAPSVESLPTPEKGLQPFTIPSLITSTATKSDPNQKVGLAFRKTGGANTVIIDKITPTSPFQGSDLREGHEILCINGQRVRTARSAAEVVRESRNSLTLVVSNAIRPPGAMYTMVSIVDHRHQDASSLDKKDNYVAGMYFKMKNGLVQLMKVDEDSPVVATSMKVGDFILAVNGKVVGSVSKVVDAFVDSAREEFIPVLYFNMRSLRATLVDTNIGDRWEKEWSDNYDECTILSPGSPGPLILRFKEDGRCDLVDPSQKSNGKTLVVSPDHPLQPVVEAINYGIICLLSAIREGVKISSSSNGRNASKSPSRIQEVKQRGNDKLAEMLDSGLLTEKEYRAIKSRLRDSKLVE